jgi:hypothetical protein
VFFFILIKLFYFYCYFLYGRYIFILFISFLIIISVIRVNSRIIIFRFADISRSANLSHFKSFFIIFGKRLAGVTSNIDGNGESSKYFRKLANSSDRVYIAFSRHFFINVALIVILRFPIEIFRFILFRIGEFAIFIARI